MARRYLLDTNTVSAIVKGNDTALRRIKRVSMAQLAISAVTEGELLFGLARRPEATKLRQVVEEFLRRVVVFPWDTEAARHYGPLRAKLEDEGQPIGNLDTMIAAHALAVGAVLVTNDQSFSRIKKLVIEDWTKAPR